ncbi:MULTISPECIES: hypothetical protein [unclassified Amycolatopsis]|uniref:hypothetical protein n=1 Tax=unclassified Amycolatopsis TaxID=2618356 RepID=UPI002E0E6834|nr:MULTISPECIES: hypothetical protein [unclassified Amycolatopsis]WSJ74114.1 hypothetical protein OG439_32245 [Amycolatopsis sp. NBC_01307]WSK82252.1 hypothetical protein OG570_17515 [Amycolatopsis sp. NBC_01286]
MNSMLRRGCGGLLVQVVAFGGEFPGVHNSRELLRAAASITPGTLEGPRLAETTSRV